MPRKPTNPGVGPTGRPNPPEPTDPAVLDRVASSMKAAAISDAERQAIEAEVQKERRRMARKPKAAAKAPKPTTPKAPPPRATVARDAKGNPVAKPTAKQAAAAVTKAGVERSIPPPGKVLVGTQKRDASLGGQQMDIEDAGQAGVHPEQRERETVVGNIAVERLRSGIERIERLQGERKALSQDISDIFSEMKSAGFDSKAVRAVLRKRAMEPAAREEEETLVDLYSRALGL